MNKQELLNYKFEQMENITMQANRLRTQGLVRDYKDIYPDIFKRISSNNGTAYIRGNVPLKLMVIII